MSIKSKTISVKDSPSIKPGTNPKAPESKTFGSWQILSWKDKALVLMGTCFGLGYAPWAPGTVSALLGVGIYLMIVWIAPVALHKWLIAAALLLFSALTLVLAPWAERFWQRKDPNVFVTDEVAGFLLTVLLFQTPSIVMTAAWGFIITRFFDILKPPPARWLERLPKGWGILVDDLCTSLYAVIFLYLFRALWPGLVGAGMQ